MRIFVGIPPNVAFLEKVQNFLQTHPLPGRIIPLENIHLTLAFLGNLTEEKVEELSQALGKIKFGNEFSLNFQKLKAKKAQNESRIYWLEAKANDSVLKLHSQIQECLKSLKIPVEGQREFLPHITLSRAKPEERAHPSLELEEPLTLKVSRFAIYESVTKQTRAEYHILKTFELNEKSTSK